MAIKISGNTIIDDSRNIIDAADVQTTTVNDGPLAGFRNAIINGNFDVWQRGTSFVAPMGSPSYFADRWGSEDDVLLNSRTISRQEFPLGQTDVPGNPKYFLRIDQEVAPTGGTIYIFGQKIEGVRTFAGQQVTFSMWVKTNSGTVNMGATPLGYFQYFGSGGSPSAPVSVTFAPTTGSTTLTTAWQLWTATFTLPSISGKTLGTNENDSLWIGFNFPLGVAFTLDIASVQLESGPVATPFERRPLAVEKTLCDRYYQVIGDGTARMDFSVGVQNATIRRSVFTVPFRTEMRVAPSAQVNFDDNGLTGDTYSEDISTTFISIRRVYSNNDTGIYTWVEEIFLDAEI